MRRDPAVIIRDHDPEALRLFHRHRHDRDRHLRAVLLMEERSIIGEGSEIYGQVYNSVIGCGVTVGEGTVIRDKALLPDRHDAAVVDMRIRLVLCFLPDTQSDIIFDHCILGDNGLV